MRKRKLCVGFMLLFTGVLLTSAGCRNGNESAKSINGRVSKELLASVKNLKSSTSCTELFEMNEVAKNIKTLSTFQLYKLKLQQNVCSVSFEKNDTQALTSKLESNGIWAEINGETLSIYAISQNETAPRLCCSIQSVNWKRLDEFDENIWGAKLRLRNASQAKLMFMDTSGVYKDAKPLIVSGDNAEQLDIPFLYDPAINIKGKFSEIELYSQKLSETRKVSTYIPPGFIGPELPVIIFTDGQSLQYYSRMIDPMIEQKLIQPIALMGIHSGRQAIVTPKSHLPKDVRGADYLPGFDAEFPNRFDAHMNFVINRALPNLINTIGGDLSKNPVSVVGHSNGGVFALHAGLNNPDLITSVLAVSAGYGGIREAQEAPSRSSTFFLSAGYFEPTFLASGYITKDTLEKMKYEVVTNWQAVGHDPEFFKSELFKFLISEYGDTQMNNPAPRGEVSKECKLFITV